MMRSLLALFAAQVRCVVLVLCLLPGFALAQQSLIVAGGAGYKRPIEEIAKGFEAESGIKVERFYGHMGQVLAQAGAGGNAAVVFGEKDALEAGGQVKFSHLHALGSGRLVLAWPKGGHLHQMKDLALPEVGRIALADVHQATFGKAAMESLQHSGLYAGIQKRLLIVGTVPQVSSYLVSGEVDAGFINLTEALAIRDQIGGYFEIPQTDYTPVSIVAAEVSGQESAAEQAFVAYLQKPVAREIFRRYGL